MQFSKSPQSLVALVVFLFLSFMTSAQSKMEYGIGIGLIYSDYHETNNLPDGIEIDIDSPKLSPSVNTYIGYKLNAKTIIAASPGINFHLHSEPFSERKLSTVYFHLPLGLQYKVGGNFSLLSDLFYDYLVNQSYEYQFLEEVLEWLTA